MRKVHQSFDSFEITDIRAAVRDQLDRPEIDTIVRTRGPKVAVGVGSRGIDRIDEIVEAVIGCLVEKGAEPFIVPAMGSHGGATSEGQRMVLEQLGVTEERMGVPICSSMEVEPIGTIPSGLPVYLAKPAAEADWILPINRVKPHTDFEGPVQSGMIKMLGIGFGKQVGCMSLHEYGTENFATLLPQIFEVYRDSGRVGFGIAVVENAYDRTMIIQAVESEKLLEEEKRLYVISKENMPRIRLDEIDVLIVERFGKEISGAGMDPNITGRTTNGPKKDYVGPTIKRIVVLNLTEKTHGNACAIASADFITRRLFESIDFDATYTNSLSCYNPNGSKIPIIARDEERAIELAVRSVPGITMETAKIARIRDTGHLEELWVSDALQEQVEKHEGIDFCD